MAGQRLRHVYTIRNVKLQALINKKVKKNENFEKTKKPAIFATD